MKKNILLKRVSKKKPAVILKPKGASKGNPKNKKYY